MTRLLRNDAVTVEAMAAEAGRRTAERCHGRHVLAIQDTTVVRSAGGGGLYLHPVIVVDADEGALLGLAHAAFLSRDHGVKAARRSKPIEDKQSCRWLDGADKAARVCAAAARVTVIADRESDIYTAFAACPAVPTFWCGQPRTGAWTTAGGCSRRWMPCPRRVGPDWISRPSLGARHAVPRWRSAS